MRQDAIIDRKQVICSNATTIGYGKWRAQTGDLLLYRESENSLRLARVIGRVKYAPALDGDKGPACNRIMVLALGNIPSHAFERWIDPKDVLEVISLATEHGDRIRQLLQWFLSPELTKYSPEELSDWAKSGFATMQNWQDYQRKSRA